MVDLHYEAQWLPGHVWPFDSLAVWPFGSPSGSPSLSHLYSHTFALITTYSTFTPPVPPSFDLFHLFIGKNGSSN